MLPVNASFDAPKNLAPPYNPPAVNAVPPITAVFPNAPLFQSFPTPDTSPKFFFSKYYHLSIKLKGNIP